MQRKIAWLIVMTMILSIFAFGCQNTAKRPLTPNTPNNVAPNNPNMTMPNTNDAALTDSEARSLAKRLADLAIKVDGVKRATVVVSDNNMANNANNNVNTDPNGSLSTDVNNIGKTGLSTDTGVLDNTGNLNRNANNLNRTNTMNNPMNTTQNRTQNNTLNNMGTNNRGTNNQMGLVVMVGLELDAGNTNVADQMDSVSKEVASRIKASDKRINQVYVTTDASLMTRIDDVAKNIAGGKTINAVRTDIDDIFRSITGKGPAF